jgi:amino acid transporter
MTPRVFRFTIGQGMAAIAAFAVTLALMPFRVAIAFSLLTTSQLVLRRNLPSDPALGDNLGCLSCLIGFVAVTFLGAGWVNSLAANAGLSIFAASVYYGFLGALIAGIVGRFVAMALPRRPSSSPDPSEAKREAIRTEIEFIERLLVQAEGLNDEEVSMKLAAYQARLKQSLQR